VWIAKYWGNVVLCICYFVLFYSLWAFVPHRLRDHKLICVDGYSGPWQLDELSDLCLESQPRQLWILNI